MAHKLSDQRIESLIRDEGAPTLNGAPYPQKKIDKIVDNFFKNKKPPSHRNSAKIKILLGAPGSGKSFNAAEDYARLKPYASLTTIYVSYDETGAIYAIPGFKEEICAILGIDDFDEHGELTIPADKYSAVEDVWKKYRPLSQHIRTQILRRAVAEGYNMVIDTTSSSPGTIHMVASFLEAGYAKHNISIEGTYAPFLTSKARVENRPRKASYLELVTKRIGAMNMLPILVDEGHELTYYYNPNNEENPQLAFKSEDGKIGNVIPHVVHLIHNDSLEDEKDLLDFISVLQQYYPEYAKDLEGYEDKIRQTGEAFRAFLQHRVLSAALKPDFDPAP